MTVESKIDPEASISVFESAPSPWLPLTMPMWTSWLVPASFPNQPPDMIPDTVPPSSWAPPLTCGWRRRMWWTWRARSGPGSSGWRPAAPS